MNHIHKLGFSALLLGWSGVSLAQNIPVNEKSGWDSLASQKDTIPAQKIDSTGTSTLYSSYGDLLEDDPVYNKRYPVWIPASRVVLTTVVNWSIARYVFKYDWAKISPETWKRNLQAKWVWDEDGFGINFIGHPHTGNYYFNVARSNGYNYLQSLPFTLGGSAVWELFGENEPPSKNDIINTTLSGMFLGEVIYRVSSNILDDRTRGANRVFREVLAGLINPPRGFNRLTQGKMFRVTSKEVYQKEPLNITVSGGIHKVNEGKEFGGGPTHYNVNIQFDYGDPFEIRKRKPFDVFRLRIESRFGRQRKILDNVMGQAILSGKNIVKGNQGLLAGIFQHFDYWNHSVFELGSLGFGGGIISRLQVRPQSQLYSRLHLALVPLAGYNTRFGPDSSEFRQYNFGGGLQARVEETMHISRWLTLGLNGYFYWLGTYDGVPGSSTIGIIKPRLLINFTRNISAGLEHHVYYHDRYAKELPDVHLRRTEQKFFIQVFLEDPKRKGKYQ